MDQMEAYQITKDLPIPGIFLAIGIIIVVYFLPQFLLIQRIRNTPTSKIRAAAVGLVELSGVPEGPAMRSPISGQKCIYWRVWAQYAPIFSRAAIMDLCELESPPFTLRDETGEIKVDASGANIVGLRDEVYTILMRDSIPFGLGEKGRLDDKKARKFIEGLEPGLKSEFKAHRNEKVEILEQWLPPQKSLYVLGNAEPLGGKSSEKSHENLIVRRKGMMFVSPSKESEILRNMRESVTGWVFFGLFIIGVSLYFILKVLVLL